MFGFGRLSDKSTVLRKNRVLCHKARDAYYDCADRLNEESSNQREIQEKCQKLRKIFEQSCKKTWVQHFDKQREREARIAKELSKVINSTAKSARGGTAGTEQN